MACGELHPNAKIREDNVRAMRAARDAGKTIDRVWIDFGLPLGISRSQVEKICLRLSWKHVP